MSATSAQRRAARTGTDPKTGPRTGPRTGPKNGPRKGPGTDPEAGPENEYEHEPENEPEADPKTAPEPAPEADPTEPRTRRRTLPGWLRGRSALLLSIALACVLELVPGMPGLPRSLAGLWLLLLAPTLLWRGTAAKVVSSRDANLLLAVGLAAITDLLIALGVNTALPQLGNAHPLTRVPLTGATAMTLIVLGALLPVEDRPAARPRGLLDRLAHRPPGLGPVAGLGGLCLLLAVAGPIRLNNGLSGTVSLFALLAVAGLLLLLLVRRRRYPTGVLESGLFTAAAALLLLNSLRGWYITGHDIQREYEYFRLTLGGSLWSVSTYPDAYNACLSITLLPVSLVRLTAVQDVYVFKVVLPLLFALTPVMVYRAVRNVAPQLVALLSAMYFMAFPTFFTDMTFLGRQEVAFVLLGCATLVLTDSGRPLRTRRLAFSVLLAGVVLSHYSTTYVVVAVLGIAVGSTLLWRLVALVAGRRGRRRRSRTVGGPGAKSFVTWWMVLVPAVLALVWAGPVTHTSGQLTATLSAAYQQVTQLGGGGTSGSSDTKYSLLGGNKVSPEQRLKDYQAQSIVQTAPKRAAGDYLPLKTVNAYPAVLVPAPDMPLTSAGRGLAAIGVDVAGMNGLLRQGAASLLQLLLLIGVVVTLRARRRVFQPLRDQVALTVGALGVIALLTVVPQLSVDYSVLRAFQQGLLFFAPFIAAGTLWVVRWAGRRAVPIACTLILGLFLDLTGVVPQLLGGYPAQLQLNNAGQYYDIYYPSTEERLAAYWLEQDIAGRHPVPVVQSESYTFGRLHTLITGPAVGGIFPTELGSHPYVVLGTTTVRTGRVTFSYQGDLVTYRYPMGLLDTTKDQIYSSEGAAIFK
ncbi:DUF2206 domain-containing protein [Kitasatospora azatica]|uniref:DUF2206 domain-containing protein n=1 Tax=Kitasatospora azatica TaxID=58347 RepID=UPI00055AE242|nr:DUF2206 domain-containing protein [Kitasatospora azatica]